MTTLVQISQIIIGLGLLNVWLLRFSKPTAYRGGASTSLSAEFAAYGLPAWSCYVLGILKVGSALALLAGLFFPVLVFPAAALLTILMLGAVAMHIKVRDPFKKSVPALSLLILCAIILAGHWPAR